MNQARSHGCQTFLACFIGSKSSSNETNTRLFVCRSSSRNVCTLKRATHSLTFHFLSQSLVLLSFCSFFLALSVCLSGRKLTNWPTFLSCCSLIAHSLVARFAAATKIAIEPTFVSLSLIIRPIDYYHSVSKHTTHTQTEPNKSHGASNLCASHAAKPIRALKLSEINSLTRRTNQQTREALKSARVSKVRALTSSAFSFATSEFGARTQR